MLVAFNRFQSKGRSISVIDHGSKKQWITFENRSQPNSFIVAC